MKFFANFVRFVAIILAVFLIVIPVWNLSGDLSEVSVDESSLELAKMLIGIFVVSPLWILSSVLKKIAKRDQ